MPRVASFIFALCCLSLENLRAADVRVEFNRDVRPILSDTCFKCHGFDKAARKADLRLDVREQATTARKGATPIAPGNAAKSEVWRRISTGDPDEVMPPPSSHLVLTDNQKNTIKRWIEQGAEYQPHWAFIAPARTGGDIDSLVVAKLADHKLTLSPQADRPTLIRRLSFDLTGLPPTLEEVDRFVADVSPNAYEKVIDRLLASPRYGERTALDWLDAARFADTHGYQRDGGRDMTPWRDWVINAFNQNMPFDQFTVEQIAGDLLPGSTVQQRVASGFNRNHMINVETGSVPEEYHAAYVADRVNTTGSVWLGLTLGCAQCHDHKFDPISQTEYYQLFALFNTVEENGIDGAKGNAVPILKLPTPVQEQHLEEIAAAIGLAKTKDEAARLQKERAEVEQNVQTSMVMQEMVQPRETFVLVRGQYDQHGPKVSPGVPAFLPALSKDAPANRLTLARWIVDQRNPLTSRVIVNRLWQSLFGTGLVKTSEDFGSQGEMPSHPELLDVLAIDFCESGWDVKRTLKRIVMSATYRQSSRITPESLATDPECRLLSRFPRKRLQAEFIRDQALAVSGLLDARIGGASVSPYQPAGLWEEMTSREDSANFTAQSYVQSHGRDLYRRTMYTFWKRTIPPPSLYAFDAPDRETCIARRSTTNTPLQALVLMNDPTFVEASRKFAERVMRDASSKQQRIALAFKLALARKPLPKEKDLLVKALDAQFEHYRSNLDSAHKLLGVGESPKDASLFPPELAAWTVVTSIILNLDEAVSKN